jgi:hypothetical protein
MQETDQLLGVARELLDHIHWLELMLALLDPSRVVSPTYSRDSLLLVELDSVVLLDIVDILDVSSYLS